MSGNEWLLPFESPPVDEHLRSYLFGNIALKTALPIDDAWAAANNIERMLSHIMAASSSEFIKETSATFSSYGYKVAVNTGLTATTDIIRD